MQILNYFKNKTVTKQAEEITISSIEPGEWFTSREHYLDFVSAFKKSANDKTMHLSSVHFLLYAILRNKDWRKGWTKPLHPGKKVEHQAKLGYAFQIIKNKWMEDYLLKPFDGTITTEMLIALRENLDDIRRGNENG